MAKQQKIYIIDKFRGVDCSSSLLDINPQHASYMRNWVLDNGILKKRNGSREIARFKEQINGYWTLKSEELTHTIVHSGKEIFVKVEEEYVKLKLPDKTAEFIRDERSYGVLQAGKLYILCGDYLVYGNWQGNWELRRVYDNEDTYIPTSTISIKDEETEKAGNYQRQLIDDLNLLTPWRYNLMVGTDKAGEITYMVDSGSIYPDSTVAITVDLFETTQPREYVCSGEGDQADLLYGSVKIGEVTRSIGKIVFNSSAYIKPQQIAGNDFDKQVYTQNNIKVLYKANYDFDGDGTSGEHSINSSKITKCVIGSLFGDSGNTDRIFVSGNPDFPNMDYYCETDDFTYFSDMNYTMLGSDSSEIGGYSRLNDGTQAITKYKTLNNETSIYFRYTAREPVFIDKFDTSGVFIGQKQIGERTIFPIKAGPSGINVASKFCNASLCGDNLFVSSNGVYSIQLAQNMAVAERVAIQRSKNICSKLAKTDLSEAVGIVFRDKYYLAVDGLCYIADTNYRSNDANYEWWVWDNIPARIWIIEGDKLLFGTSDGRIIQLLDKSIEVLDNGYVDRIFETGGIASVDYINNYICIAEKYEVKKGFICILKGAEIFQKALSDVKVIGDLITVTGQEVRYGWTVFVDTVSREPYELTDILRTGSEISFRLKRQDGTYYSSDTLQSIAILRILNDRKLKVSEVTRSHISGELYNLAFKLTEYDREIVFLETPPGSEKTVRFEINKPVQAEWISGITDLSAPYMAKTLTDIYCTPEAISDGRWEIGYKTYNRAGQINIQGTGLFDFNKIDFNRFSFNASNFPRGYHEYIMERDKNFIQFMVRSSDSSGAAINNFGVKYTVNREIKGVE